MPSARDDGYLVKNPSAVVASQALGHVEKLMGRFGLTPSDRAGLDVSQAESPDDIAASILAVTARRG